MYLGNYNINHQAFDAVAKREFISSVLETLTRYELMEVQFSCNEKEKN